MLKTEVEDRSFKLFPKDRANVNALENHAWSLLLHKNKLRYMKIRNLWRKWTRKSILSAAKRPRKWHVHCVCFENATSRANTNVMLTSCFYVCYRARYWRWRHFLWRPWNAYTVKAAKQVYNSTWIALLKHGFVLVKTWLLIACGTGFYAIILDKYDGQAGLFSCMKCRSFIK